MPILSFIQKYRYETIAVADGAIVMMLELVGARFMAPYLGTSQYVWTAIIGVILGALALGYWYGGRIADKHASDAVLVRIFFISAAVLTLTLFVQQPLLQWISHTGGDARLQAFIAALLLFAGPAVFMGMVSPCLVKLRLTSLTTAGQSVGGLYAAGTAGSILGTFLSGYWLIGVFGSRSLGWMLVGCLVFISFLANRRALLIPRLLLLALVLFAALISPRATTTGNFTIVYDADTAYARYRVLQKETPTSDVRYLLTDNQGVQSGIDLKQPSQPLFDYTERFMEAADEHGPPKTILMIGGGTFTVPKLLSQKYPESHIDVVEIDPALTALGEQYFGFSPAPNISVINQDGRVFVNNNDKKYDLIYIDAYNALTPPFHLTTIETMRRLHGSLSDNGSVIINLVATPFGERAVFAQSAVTTIREAFPYVLWLQSNANRSLDVRQNMIISASKNQSLQQRLKQRWEPSVTPLPVRGIILSDDFAPVEHMTAYY